MIVGELEVTEDWKSDMGMWKQESILEGESQKCWESPEQKVTVTVKKNQLFQNI